MCGDSIDNTLEENSAFSLIWMRWLPSVRLHQQNPPVLNWRCWLTQVDLYNGRKTVVVVVVVLEENTLWVYILAVIQPSVTKLWRKDEALTSATGLALSFSSAATSGSIYKMSYDLS